LNPSQVHSHQNHTSKHQRECTSTGILNTYLSAENEQQYPLLQEKQHYHNQHKQSGGSLGTSSCDHMNYMPPPQDQNVVPSTENHIKESHHTGHYIQSVDPQMLSRKTQPLQPASTVCTPPDNMHLQYQQPPAFHTPDGSYRLTMTRINSNTSKNKLPHGLTVYELKEMTKARLQSEAAEKSSEINEIQETCRDRVSPLDFDSGDSIQERVLSRASSSTGRINNNPLGFYLQNQQVAPKIVQAQTQPQSQMLQSGLHQSSSMLGGGTAPPSCRATCCRTDTWETTSVASHNSTIYSDNLGSESTSEIASFGHSCHRNRAFTYPAVQPLKPLDVNNTSTTTIYKETRSFTNPSPVQASPRRGSGVIGGTSLFNAAVGGNRRRAVTLSPNTDSILEDRPFQYDTYDTFESGDRLEIPNFSAGLSTPAGLSASTPTQGRQREYSPVLEQLGLDNSYLSNGTDTSSVFRSLATNNRSPLVGISQIGSRELDSLHAFQPNSQNNSNLFGEAPKLETRVAAPPPGFVSSRNASPSGETAFSRVGSMDSYYNINRPNLHSEDNLLSDFGAVLDLSGPPRVDRERANTYTFGSKQSNSINAHLGDDFRF